MVGLRKREWEINQIHVKKSLSFVSESIKDEYLHVILFLFFLYIYILFWFDKVEIKKLPSFKTVKKKNLRYHFPLDLTKSRSKNNLALKLSKGKLYDYHIWDLINKFKHPHYYGALRLY